MEHLDSGNSVHTKNWQFWEKNLAKIKKIYIFLFFFSVLCNMRIFSLNYFRHLVCFVCLYKNQNVLLIIISFVVPSFRKTNWENNELAEFLLLATLFTQKFKTENPISQNFVLAKSSKNTRFCPHKKFSIHDNNSTQN